MEEGIPLFYIWGEFAERCARRKRPRSREHPFSASHEELNHSMNLVYFSDIGARRNLPLKLPTGATPICSLHAPPENEKVRLKEWSVAAIEFDARHALEFINQTSQIGESGNAEVKFANDILYLVEVLKLASELVMKQRYLPGIERQNKVFMPRWKFFFDDHTNERMELLQKMMPQSLSEFAGEGEEALMYGILCGFAEALIQKFLQEKDILDAGDLGYGIEYKWMDALFRKKELDSDIIKLDKLYGGIKEWSGSIENSNLRNFMTCFRLSPPSDKPISGNASGNKEEWLLDYLVRSKEDTSLIIEAAKIWGASPGVGKYFKGGIDAAQNALLQDLGFASRLFKPITSSLSHPAPTGCSLKLGEVSNFLRQSAVILKDSGYGVMLPSWLDNNQKSPFGISVALKSKSEGFFSLDSLMAFDWKLSIGGEEISERDFMLLASLKSEIVNIKGRWIGLNTEVMQKTIDMIRRFKKDGGISARDALALMLSDHASGKFTFSYDNKILKGIFDRLKGEGSFAMLPHPLSLNGTLRDYQLVGYSWLDYLSGYGIGACLADDMGLGKTIQLISLLLNRKQKNPSAHTLLICPTSVVGNWVMELQKFAPSLKFMVHHGNDRLKGRTFLREAGKNDLVISTYQLTYRDFKHLCKINWNLLALDEAQNIKNVYTKQSQAVRKLSSQSRIALTGTPIENRLLELWSIMDFLNPGYLKSMDSFMNNYGTPIEKYRDAAKRTELQALIKPFLLRRLKSDKNVIKDLPDKFEAKMYCTLTKEQATLYQAVVDSVMAAIEENEEGIKRKGIILNSILRLKQVCDHPSLYLADGSELGGRSGKLARLEEMLEKIIENGESSLIFTQYAQMGGMLSAYLQKKLGCEIFFLHGGTPRKERDRMVSVFQEAILYWRACKRYS